MSDFDDLEDFSEALAIEAQQDEEAAYEDELAIAQHLSDLEADEWQQGRGT